MMLPPSPPIRPWATWKALCSPVPCFLQAGRPPIADSSVLGEQGEELDLTQSRQEPAVVNTFLVPQGLWGAESKSQNQNLAFKRSAHPSLWLMPRSSSHMLLPSKGPNSRALPKGSLVALLPPESLGRLVLWPNRNIHRDFSKGAGHPGWPGAVNSIICSRQWPHRPGKSLHPHIPNLHLYQPLHSHQQATWTSSAHLRTGIMGLVSWNCCKN